MKDKQKGLGTVLDAIQRDMTQALEEEQAANAASREKAAEEERLYLEDMKAAEAVGAEHKKMIADFLAVKAKALAEERARIDAGRVTEADVAAGKCNIGDLLKSPGDQAAAAEALAAVDARMADMIQAARAKDLEVKRAVARAAGHAQSRDLYLSRCGWNMLEKMRRFVKSAEAALGSGGMVQSAVDRSKAVEQLERAESRGLASLQGQILFGLTLERAELLKLDAAFPAALFGELDQAVAELRAAVATEPASTVMIKIKPKGTDKFDFSFLVSGPPRRKP